YGSYVLVEVINADWVDHHLPDDAGGNVYRGSTGSHNADLQNLTTKQAALNKGYSKTSNQSEDDWRDLIALSGALSTNSTDAQYVAAIRENINVELWMRY